MDARLARSRLARYNQCLKQPNQYMKFYMGDDTTECWILIENLEGNNDEYVDGEYLVKMKLPAEFPHKAPDFYFMTPNGVYEAGKKCCINIGSYHPENNQSAVMGIMGFAEQLVSGFIGWRDLGGGINLVNSSVDDKRKLAEQSRSYNRAHNADIVRNIEENYANYSQKWKTAAASSSSSGAAGAPSNAVADRSSSTPAGSTA